MINDTIVAPATNIQTQAISLIRVSGEDAFKIVNKLFKKPLQNIRGVEFKKLIFENEIIDEVVIVKFISPNSFTGEDVIEINCHGSVLIVNKIISILIILGARMALKGEFTQRAFVGGRINLIQAEAINDLIAAENDFAMKVSLRNLDAKKNNELLEIKNELLEIISKIQVSIDYPDYDDVENSTTNDYLHHFDKIQKSISNILKLSKIANKSFNGIPTAIIGETNVGKSSLLNFLLNEDKAIVSSIKGTTRDILEGKINLNNLTLNLIDTAGIRKTKNEIEKIGIEKSLLQIEKAELILFVIDATKYNDVDNNLLAKIKNKPHVIILNKKDLITEQEIQKIKLKYGDVVFISIINNDIGNLLDVVEDKFNFLNLKIDDQPILANANQIGQLEILMKQLEIADLNLKNNFSIDIIAIDLQNAWNTLNNLIGETYDEEILDNIFRKYCLGK